MGKEDRGLWLVAAALVVLGVGGILLGIHLINDRGYPTIGGLVTVVSVVGCLWLVGRSGKKARS